MSDWCVTMSCYDGDVITHHTFPGHFDTEYQADQFADFVFKLLATPAHQAPETTWMAFIHPNPLDTTDETR